MSVILSKSVFFHIPKTGGTWVKNIFEIEDMAVQNMANYHFAPSTNMRNKYKTYLFFCFVRHPLTFYKSFWGFQMKKNWGKRWGRAFIQKTKSYDFNEFIDKVVENYPSGFLNVVYNKYTPMCDAIGKYENIREDLIKILKRAGEKVPEETINAEKPVNTSTKFHDKVSYTDNQVDDIMRIERPVINKFYKNYEIDNLI